MVPPGGGAAARALRTCSAAGVGPLVLCNACPAVGVAPLVLGRSCLPRRSRDSQSPPTELPSPLNGNHRAQLHFRRSKASPRPNPGRRHSATTPTPDSAATPTATGPQRCDATATSMLNVAAQRRHRPSALTCNNDANLQRCRPTAMPGPRPNPHPLAGRCPEHRPSPRKGNRRHRPSASPLVATSPASSLGSPPPATPLTCFARPGLNPSRRLGVHPALDQPSTPESWK
ncbi:hypothetical protein ATK36_1788 [Amycolatopsis sulphurea]|uniref:Uncharacterized protein n=1 Tax=Amycolatopsis sulphurea TaxID=76022 RepID=A0A2A9F8C0_9PSEU|nr:hypothetical protein ATK36_1788 [Amycolatopsis sulphurea]